MQRFLSCGLVVLSLLVVMWCGVRQAGAVTIYDAGVSPGSAGLTFGDHLVSPQLHPSVAGTGGSGISNAGDGLSGTRTYTFDKSAQADLTDGIANRGDTNFAMLIWDMGQTFNSMRLYTHQDHYNGGLITDPFVAQDIMEYSVWGSQDGDNFVLLSDVTSFNINGGGVGLPTYTFGGTAPTVVYRGGSSEFGIVNAYTRDYVFATAFQFYGVRTSQISLNANDADPEIDAVAGFSTPVPEPSTTLLLGIGLIGLVGLGRRVRKQTTQP